MKSYIDAQGLHLETMSEIIDDLETKFKTIYGTDINLDPNSPDGQMIAIFAQAKTDILDLINQVYTSFDPDQAIGVSLDQRAAINGVQRTGATYTVISVSITASEPALTIYGLDTAVGEPFTVADANGNNFQLLETIVLSVGANTLQFRSSVSGAVASNPITQVVTIIRAIDLTTNPQTPTVIALGQNEQTDPQVRATRQAAVAKASIGFLPGTTGALKLIDGVTDARVYENATSTIDSNGVPAHAMWAIVDGGTSANIADLIYIKRNAGCGMKGSVNVPILQVNGTTFNVLFDRPVYEDLYLNISVTSMDVAHSVDPTYLANQILSNFVYKIYEAADISAVTAFIKGLDALAVVVDAGFSVDDTTWHSYIYPSSVQNRFVLSLGRIVITVV
jgi:uncharacterized phage protein gp47/JayE